MLASLRARRKRSSAEALRVVGGNLAIIGLVIGTNVNVTAVIFGLAGVLVFSVALAWIMFQVMDRY